MTLAQLAGITRPDPFDSWGPLTFPTSTGRVFTTLFPGWGKSAGALSVPPSDPDLACCLDFIATFVQTDEECQAAWQSCAYGVDGPIRNVWLHNPSDVVFSTGHLPALYMWRQKGKLGYIADDYLQGRDVVKALWIFPPGKQEAQRIRSVFDNVLPKAIIAGVERGRTPSWQQPDDPDPLAAGQGSLFYTFAGFDELTLEDWQNTRVVIKDADPGENYYGLDFTFTLKETQVYGIGRQPPYYPDTGMTATVQTEEPSTIGTWAPDAFYAPLALVQPVAPNGFFYVGAFVNALSGGTQPVFPTHPGATVTDGTQVWTCVGLIDGTSVTGPLESPPVTGDAEP